MAKYQDLGDGLYGLDTPYGRAVLRTDESTLQRGGHEPMTLDQPVAMQDPGALSEGATAKAPTRSRGFNSQQAVADAEMGKAGYAQPSAPVGTDALPPAQPGDKFSSAPVVKEQQEQFQQGFAPRPVPTKPGATPNDRVAIGGPARSPGQPGEEVDRTRQEVIGRVMDATPGGGPFTPGGMRVVSRTVKGKELPAGSAQALQQEAARPDPTAPAAMKVAYTQVLANEAQADALRDWGEEEQGFLDADRQKRAAIDQEITAKENEAQRVWQEAGKVPAVDAQRLWNSKTTMGKILASVLLGLGYIISAKTGSNPVQAAFDKANNDDIEEQKLAHEKAQAAGKAADNAYARELDRWGKPELAAQSMRLRGEKIFDAMLKERALRTQNPELVARVELQNAEREEARNRQWGVLLSQLAPTVETTSKYVPPSGGGGVDPLKRLERGAKASEAYDKITGKKPTEPGAQRKAEWDLNTRVRLPDGRIGYAPADQKKAADNVILTTKVVREQFATFDRLEQDLKDGKIDPLKWARDMASVSGMVADTRRQSTGSGTFDRGYQELFARQSGLPQNVAVLVGIAKSDYARGLIRRTLNNLATGAETLQQETLRQTVSLDPGGTIPAFEQTPEK